MISQEEKSKKANRSLLILLQKEYGVTNAIQFVNSSIQYW
jgi:hypothetical protein